MPTPTPFLRSRFILFFSLLSSVMMLFTACQKEAVPKTNIEQPSEVISLNDVDLRQMVLEQVYGIPTAKMQHPKIQQLATTFLAHLSAEERQILPSKIQALKKKQASHNTSNRAGAPTPQTITDDNSLQFGQSLAEQGDFLFVGEEGSVHIYHQSNGKYTAQQVILGDADAGFGYQIAVARNWLAIGAPFENDFAGAIYLYERTEDHWIFSQKIAGTPMGLIGQRFAMHGNNLVTLKQDGILGSLQVYTLGDSDWQLDAEIGKGFFFWDIAMDGNRITANGGTSLFDPAVHVFAKVAGEWTAEAVLNVPGALLFRAVALQGKTIMANFLLPMDKTYVFTYKNDKWEADGEIEIPGPIPFTNTHWIALSGDLAVVTVADDDINDGVHVYEKSFRKWRHVETVELPDAIANGQRVGDAVLITNRGKVVLGSPGINEMYCFCPQSSETVFDLPGQVVIY